MPQVHSILFLTTINNFVLLFTVHLYDENLDLVAFLCLCVGSINVKINFFNKFANKSCTFPNVRMFPCLLLFFISMILLVLFGGIKANPGLNPGYSNSFTYCHWNLNSIAAHNLSLLQAFNSIHMFEIICLPETYLDNSYHSDDDQLVLPGYKLIRTDNPNNIKRGGVCIFIEKLYQ